MLDIQDIFGAIYFLLCSFAVNMSGEERKGHHHTKKDLVQSRSIHIVYVYIYKRRVFAYSGKSGHKMRVITSDFE